MSPRLVLCIAASACLGLSACGRDPAPAPPAPATTVASGQLTDSAHSDKYRVIIHYPALPATQAPLAEALRQFGDHAKHDFLATFADPARLPRTSSYPWTMTLDFKVEARTPDFVSVVAKGDSYTGGAHGNPILASFTYAIGEDRIVTLEDLFTDMPGGLRALSAAARADLRGRLGAPPGAGIGSDANWIDTGTAPTAANYQVFSVHPGGDRADGLQLWFAPYQVASYADGVQTVEIPAAAFAAQLKPGYRAAFGLAGAH
ncbi:MAG TPA: DUF4163 domain-containing protein [Rhodanobacteraceae bacterium]|nr:DUF4163 domain-containing protein [Rhodanobacteraceae bacterium]